VPLLADVHQPLLAAAFQRALATQPEQRFSCCLAFVGALDRSWTRAGAADLPLCDAASAAIAPLPTPGDDKPAAGGAPRLLQLVTALALGLVAGAGLWLIAQPFAAGSATSASPSVDVGRAFTDAPLAPPAPAEIEPVAPAEVGAEAAPPERANAWLPGLPGRRDVSRASRVAGLLVHSAPEGALVSIDGVERGSTPLAVRGLPLGVRSLVLTLPGYRPLRREVTLTAERPSRTLDLRLTASPRAALGVPAMTGEAVLVVESRPEGASVWVDGRAAGVTPVTLGGLAPGVHIVRIARHGYRAVKTTVAIRPGTPARIGVRLEGEQ
jgi:hypothetical protein